MHAVQPTTIRPAVAAHPVSPGIFDNPANLARYLKQEQPERWTQFHQTNPRILIIDDNPRTTQILERSLDTLYGENVESVNDPERAIERIRNARLYQQPFDVIVLDLHMPGKTGMQVMKELAADCPATVINTASMMSPALADLCIQMDSFRAANASQLIIEHVNDRRPAGLPLAPVFINLKDSGIKQLSDKIDAALLLAQQMPDYSTAIGDFIQAYNPRLVPVTFTAVSVHQIVEEIRNCVLQIKPCVTELLRQNAIQKTEWWKMHGTAVESALTDLEHVKFSDQHLEDAFQAWNDVHTLVGKFMELSCRGLELPGQPNELESWKHYYNQYSTIITELANGMRSYVHDAIDLSRMFDLLCANHALHSCNCCREPAAESVMIKDERKLLSTALDNIFTAFRKHLESLQAGIPDIKEVSVVSLRFIPEGQRWNEDPQITRTLKLLKAGDYFELTFRKPSDISFDQILSGSLPRMSELLRGGIMAWSHGDKKELSLYIKASNHSIDYKDYNAGLQRQAAEVSYLMDVNGNEAPVKIYADRGESQNLTCIGDLPGIIDSRTVMHSVMGIPGLIFEQAGHFYFSSGSMHLDAARHIIEFLTYNQRASETQGHALLPIPSLPDVYKNGIRVTFGVNDQTQIELNDSSAKAEKAMLALIGLGHLPQRINISDQYFAGRAIISEQDPPAQAASAESRSDTVRFGLNAIFEELSDKIKEALGQSATNEISQQTVSEYLTLTSGARLEEPSFIIRSRTGLTFDEQSVFMSQLAKVMRQTEIARYAQVEIFDSQVLIEGQCARKSGLYLYDPEYQHGYEEDHCSCTFQKNLKPLISRSSPSRLLSEGIVKLRGISLPPNSLIFAGGDHSLSYCEQQFTLALATELILQSMKISYDACRGHIHNQSHLHTFDGKNLAAQHDPELLMYI